MPNKIVLVTAAANLLFIGAGILELTFALIFQSRKDNTPSNGEEAVRSLLYGRFPLTAAIVNAAFIFATAILAVLPSLLMPTARGWLKLAGYLVVICAVFTMCVGLYLWIMTLRMGDEFFDIYLDQSSEIQDLMQTSVSLLDWLESPGKEMNGQDILSILTMKYVQFECCGYLNSTSPAFVTNPTCPSPAAAALLRGCKTAISAFGNAEVDQVFTAVFGVVGKESSNQLFEYFSQAC